MEKVQSDPIEKKRLETDMKGAIQGIGLGLRVYRTLVEAHGRRIWVEFEKERGVPPLFLALPETKNKFVLGAQHNRI